MFTALFITLLVFATTAIFGSGIPFLRHVYERVKSRKLSKGIHVGHQYIRKYNDPNPFEPQWGSIITIKDKREGTDGLTYIKYVYNDSYYEFQGTVLDVFKGNKYVPYTGQDIEEKEIKK